MRGLRDLLATLRSTGDAGDECAENCLESLCNAEGIHSLTHLGEHEEAVIEAERRRWEARRPAAPEPR